MLTLTHVRLGIAGLMSAALIGGGFAAAPAIARPSAEPLGPTVEQAPVRAQTSTVDVTLAFRWSLVPWRGADDVPVGEAIRGTGAAEGGSDVSSEILAIYAWDSAAQTWSGYFVSGEGIPGANDLETLQTDIPYWIAINGPDEVTWTIATPDD